MKESAICLFFFNNFLKLLRFANPPHFYPWVMLSVLQILLYGLFYEVFPLILIEFNDVTNSNITY
jgi:hypothetical protein